MPNTLEFYLSKGFDSKAAAYFAAGRKRPVAVAPQDSTKILITFDNAEKRIFDMTPLIKEGTVYSVLRDSNIFKRCYIDSNGSVCWDIDPNIDSEKIWSNKIDLGADTCYLESASI